MIGLLTAKWIRKKRRSHASQTSVLSCPPQSQAELVAVLSNLTTEVSNLRTAISEILHHSGRPSRQNTESTVSEFVSAQTAPESDDEFFDLK